jgi:hypothetical protein
MPVARLDAQLLRRVDVSLDIFDDGLLQEGTNL